MSSLPQVLSVNFGALHRKIEFSYELDVERLPAELQDYKSTLEQLTTQELHFLRWRMAWKSLARQKQLPPKEFDEFLKLIWVLRSGRGFGKTLAGANWLGIEAASFPSMYCAVAPTKDDVRYTCFEGPTGLYSSIPPQLIVDKNLALPSLTLWNGSIIRGFAGDTPERLRGPQHAGGWLDEIACLVAGTLVRTSTGEIPIEQIKCGDLVWTRRGLRRVLAAGVSAPRATLWEMVANDGSRLVGTAHHPVWSESDGVFVPLHAMEHGTTLATWPTSLSGTVSAGIGGASATRTVAGARYTEPNTNSIRGRFLKGMQLKFIIATITRVIIGSLTWLQSRTQSTRGFIREALCSGVRDKSLVLGRRDGLSENLESSSAQCARNSIARLGSVPNSAHKSAATSPIATLERNTHVVSVKALGCQGVVYNLDVEGEHEFFANGILTHNSWLYAQAAWDNIMFGLRLGAHPRLCVTGTPKPSAFIRDLMKRKDAVVVVGSTYENRDNLTESYFENVAKYEGTKIGRQEIHGEVLDPEEAGYIKRSQIRMWPADRPLPRFQYILVSLDTAFTEETHDKKRQENDPTACTVWGLFLHGQPAVKNIMLLDAWQEWLGFPELIQRVKKERRRRYGAIVQGPVLLRPKINSVQTPQPQGKAIDLLLIEEKASGTSLIQMLAREDILAHAYNPGNLDKLQRLHVVSLLPAHGRVWMVESDRTPGEFREWAEPVITQLCSYSGEGSLDYDDLLDTTTQAWRYLLDHHIGALTIPRDPEEERRKAAVEARHKIERKQRVNPYDG